MLKKLSSLLKFILAVLFVVLNTIFWCSLIYPLILFKLISPQKWRNLWTDAMIALAEKWIACNNLAFAVLYRISWNVQGADDLDRKKSYLVSCNHQSWVDILVLQHTLGHKIPFMRFFLKQELIYVPFLGLAWWGLDFPFMSRYSNEYLIKHPEKRGQDLIKTQKACEKFKGRPISILNFLEGTRFTEEKHRRSSSPYKNLLAPKVGGVAFVLQSMGDQFDSFLDVTIVYPDGVVSLMDLLWGKFHQVNVVIQKIPIPKDLTNSNYKEAISNRKQMRSWIENIWKEKDLLMEGLKS